MSRVSGTVDLEIPDRLSREVAVAVVAQLDRVSFVDALADAVVRRMAGETGGSATYDRDTGSPDPGAGPRRGVAGYGDVTDDGLTE